MFPMIGNITGIINNKDGLYEGNLRHYFRIVWRARNRRNPFHNLRHMLHVFMLCANAALFYKVAGMPLSLRDVRNMFIAALMHDYNHPGRIGNDDLNLQFAIRGLERYILPEDKPYFDKIKQMMLGTQHPYVIPASKLDTCGLILRDADICQVMSTAWLQQVICGLAAEMDFSEIEILKMQRSFLEGIQLNTFWAKSMFKDQIPAKIEEAEEFIAILEE